MQAVMMDALISTFVEELRRRAAQYPDDLQGHMLDHGTDVDGNCTRPSLILVLYHYQYFIFLPLDFCNPRDCTQYTSDE